MVVEQGRTGADVAESLGVDRSLVASWRKAFEAEGTVGTDENARLTPETTEIHRLRRELVEAREERDILKKALAYFAKERK